MMHSVYHSLNMIGGVGGREGVMRVAYKFTSILLNTVLFFKNKRKIKYLSFKLEDSIIITNHGQVQEV